MIMICTKEAAGEVVVVKNLKVKKKLEVHAKLMQSIDYVSWQQLL